MATVLTECTTKKQRAVVRFLWAKGLPAKDIHKEMLPVYADYQPESKRASMQWKHPSSSCVQKFKVTPSAGKVMLTVLWDCQGVLLTKFKNKGHSSDCSYSRTAKTSRTATTSSTPQRPNPYAQLTKEAKQKLKQKADIRSETNTPTQTGNSGANVPESPTSGSEVTDIVKQGETATAVSGVVDSSDDRSLTENGEICDDEEELYQEIRSNENTDEARLLFETYKALHQAQMEDICKRVQPHHFLRQLQSDGYFDYNYQGHTRDPADSPNKKPNIKKPNERLFQLLSIY